jgi:predicted transcriptional regulator
MQGKELRRRRQQLGIRQHDLTILINARASHFLISQPDLSKIELGRFDPTPELASHLEAVLSELEARS